MSYLWGRLLRRRDFCIIGMLLIVWALLAVLAPYIAPYDPYEQDLTMRLTGKTRQYISLERISSGAIFFRAFCTAGRSACRSHCSLSQSQHFLASLSGWSQDFCGGRRIAS